MFRLALSLFLLTLAPGAAAAQGIALLSHRAVYDLALARSSSGSGVISVRGLLVLEWTDTCEGYTLTQRMRSESNEEDKSSVSDFNMSTWEAKDGRNFRFASRHVNDGAIEEVRGVATLEAQGTGSVEYKKPEGEVVMLPKGTLFPTAHQILLLKKATEKASYVHAQTFDGSSARDAVQDAGAWIGEQLPASSYRGVGQEILEPLVSWKVRIAYFPTDSTESVPQYEVAYRMFENGVATDIILDYGDFALKGTLKTLDRTPNACGG